MIQRLRGLRFALRVGIVVIVFIGPCLAQVSIDAGEASGYPGWTVEVPVSLGIAGSAPSSLGAVLFFPDPRNVKVAARSDGKPDCRVTANIGTPASFLFWPVGCVHDEDECDSVRVLLVDLSGAQPNLPAGELFRCKAVIAASAPAGTYPVELRDPDAAARGGVSLVASGADGAVQVLPPPGGGGGCAVAATGRGENWWLAPVVGALLALSLLARRPAQWGGRGFGLRAAALLIATGLSCFSVEAIAQPIEFVAEGSWSVNQRQGKWHAILGIDTNGAISGRVKFEALDVLPEANLLATWSRGAIQQGSLFRTGTIVRLGRLRATFGTAGVRGEVSLVEGGSIAWQLQSIRARREKTTPPLAAQRLARGQPAVVLVTIDDYPAVREARRRVRELVRYEWDSEEAEAAYDAAMARLQDAVAQKLAVSGAILLSKPRGVPQLRLYLRDWTSLSDVLSLPEVSAVHDPQIYSPTLSESLPLIGQPAAMSRGFDGTGVSVAVVDTRIDHLRPAYPGGPLAFGDGCANGVGAPGCAIVATYDAAADRQGEEETPEHGTNVAGISWSVAPASGIVGVDVFKAVGAYDDDIIRGLNWVRSNWRQHNIVAVNLSLGGGEARDICYASNLAPAIRELRRIGRIVVAASGNDGWTDRIADPACVARVVRVGAVYDRDFSRSFPWSVCEDVNPARDQVACFSNSAFFLTALAPGAFVNFAGLSFAGTSQAAPHVSGAVAALRTQGRFRFDSADCTIARIVKTGDVVTDHRNGLRFPRLNLDAATLTRPNSVGDCNDDSRVLTEELEKGVAIALGTLPITACPSFDATGDGEVTIDELVTGTNIALTGCAVGASGVV